MADANIDEYTGEATVLPLLDAGKYWLNLQLVPASFSFDEKPKNGKPGNWYSITAGGNLNAAGCKYCIHLCITRWWHW
jgi:hypothetical protein